MDTHTQQSPEDLEALKKKAIIAVEQFEMNGKLALEELHRRGEVLTKSVEISVQARKAGNELFTKKGHELHTHRDILVQYSKSIAFAPKNSKELALGYSNRSAFLMHIFHYEEALIDIDRALELTKEDAIEKKLQDRRNRCLNLINKQNLGKSVKNLTLDDEQESFAAELINFKPSATLPCASDCVGLAYNETFGRHLVATRNIKPGEVLIVEEAYICYPKKSQIYILCSHCLQIAWNGIPCDECVFTLYCSETCKQEACAEYHEIECSMIKYIDSRAESVFDVMAAVRLFGKAVENETLACVIDEAKKKTAEKGGLEPLLSDGILCPDKFKSYYNLMSHSKKSESKKDEIEDENICETMMMYLLSKHTNFDDSLLKLHVLARIREILIETQSILKMNSYSYQAPIDCQCENHRGYCDITCNARRGGFISSTCSLLNHSCVSNVNRVFVPKRKVIVFANSPIKKGEQLFITYGANAEDSADVERRQNLLKGYQFTCQCMACKDGFEVEEQSLLKASIEKINKVRIEFYKCFHRDCGIRYLSDPAYELELSKDFFKEVRKFSELLYKYLDYGPALVYNARCTRYFTILYSKLYGEKRVIPNEC